MTENMKLWDAVSKTDPAHTKTVNQRGGFTAIGANYQIKMATEQFGPIGIGWGYIAGEPIFSGTLIIVPVTMWHGERSNTFGPELGCEAMVSQGRDGKDRIDTDAPKKATTDALTKLLSRLGFNADVFLGLFDDNKYVQQRQREEDAKKPQEPVDHTPKRDELIKALNDQAESAHLYNVWTNGNFNSVKASLPEPMQNEVQATYDKRKGELET